MSDEHQAQADTSTDQTAAAAHSETAETPDKKGASELESSGSTAEYEAELAAIMAGDEGETPRQGDEEGEQHEQQNDSEEEQEQESDETPEEEESEEEPESAGPNRIRLKRDDDRAVAAIAKAKGISLVEAAKIFEGTQPKATETAEAEEEAPGRTAADIEAELKETRTNKRQAMRELDMDLAAELDEKDEALQLELAEARASESTKTQTKAEKEHAEAVRIHNESYATACELYPALADENSPLFKRVMEMDQAETEHGTPLSRDPKKSLHLVKAAAGELGIPMKAKAAATAKKPGKPEAPKSTRPAPASGSARTSTPAPNEAEKRIESVQTTDDYEKELALLGVKRLGR